MNRRREGEKEGERCSLVGVWCVCRVKAAIGLHVHYQPKISPSEFFGHHWESQYLHETTKSQD